MMNSRNMKTRERGFSAIEMLISVALITLVLGVAFAGMRDMQARNFAEGSRVDTLQETRDFIDQVVRDIHVAGYPSSRVLGQAVGTEDEEQIKVGYTHLPHFAESIDGIGRPAPIHLDATH